MTDAFDERRAQLVDRIGRPADAKGGAFSKIIDYWAEDGDERLTCFEVSTLGQTLVQWVEDGDIATASAVLAAVEAVVAENLPDNPEGLLAFFVGPASSRGLMANWKSASGSGDTHRIYGRPSSG